ncbi:hypothetical protein AOB57_001810 [Methanosarcina flavescens]|uniref:Uncharacterized protein n=1 Tax=Methanosarcina flavescens TaxID=1715806 RepID=A0A660HPC2_9EURY|nr:hypothetical protein AOB57_001810 [Methanosarcina flavescens]
MGSFLNDFPNNCFRLKDNYVELDRKMIKLITFKISVINPLVRTQYQYPHCIKTLSTSKKVKAQIRSGSKRIDLHKDE